MQGSSLSARTIDAVLRRVDELTDEIVDFTRELVRIPSVNPPGEHYVDCAHLLGERYRRLGYAVEYITAEGRPEHTERHPRLNVVGRLEGAAAGGKTLHFNGHTDVVPAGAGWTLDPWAGEVRAGRLYGRGANDMKGGLAASLYAVEAIRRAGVRLAGHVEQSGTVDEESGGWAGVAYLAERGYFSPARTDYVVITEPLNPDRLCLGHRGVFWFELTTFGSIGHGSMPQLAVNAIDAMAEVIAEINHRLKPRLAERVTAIPVEPAACRHPTINLNAIAGGQPVDAVQTPCVPDRCVAIFDRRFLAEEPLEAVRAEVDAVLREVAQRVPGFRYRLADRLVVEPNWTPPEAEVVRAFDAAVELVYGRPPAHIASPGTYDQKHVQRIGGVRDCIAYGPGILDVAHQPDEWVGVDDLRRAAAVMALGTLMLVGTA